MSDLTHFDAAGHVHMVDVSSKAATARRAVAQGTLHMHSATLQRIKNGTHAKGDVLGVARIAAIMAAKRTPELIPLCHPLSLSHIAADFQLQEDPPALHLTVTTDTLGPTGVEMEALTAVSVGLLTVYDMCKAVDRGMILDAVRLRAKSGGKSGCFDFK